MTPTACAILCSIGMYNELNGDLERARVSYDRSLTRLDTLLRNQPSFVAAKDVTATVRGFEKALDYRERVVGDTDKTLETSLQNLSRAYSLVGRTADAARIEKRLVDVRAASLSKDKERQRAELTRQLRESAKRKQAQENGTK